MKNWMLAARQGIARNPVYVGRPTHTKALNLDADAIRQLQLEVACVVYGTGCGSGDLGYLDCVLDAIAGCSLARHALVNDKQDCYGAPSRQYIQAYNAWAEQRRNNFRERFPEWRRAA